MFKALSATSAGPSLWRLSSGRLSGGWSSAGPANRCGTLAAEFRPLFLVLALPPTRLLVAVLGVSSFAGGVAYLFGPLVWV